jgi:luciferase family oxidoreductase group 1
MTYKLSILDQSPIVQGATAVEAIADSLDLARFADHLGYHRYWLSEHHGVPTMAGTAPEALIGPVALATRRLRVGSGGVLLRNHAPFKVAETFSLLAAMAPGRIDLGIGRELGGSKAYADALRPGRLGDPLPDDFAATLGGLMALLEERSDVGQNADSGLAALRAALPRGGVAPQVWLLGTSADSARLAGSMGLRYCLADFIKPGIASAAAIYRNSFVPSRLLSRPELAVATWAIAAEDTPRADHLAEPLRMLVSLSKRGELVPVPTPEEASAWLVGSATPPGTQLRITVGTPRAVKAGLDTIATDYGADELFVVAMLHDHATRRSSYDMLAAEYGLRRDI